MERGTTLFRRPISFVFFLFLLFFMAGCEDVIDVNLRSVEPRLVIEAAVRLDQPASVLITKTKDFASPNEYEPITDAVVKVWDDNGKEELLETDSYGYYTSAAIRGEEGRTYRLSVMYDGQHYTAVSTMPSMVKIDSLSLFDFPVLDYPFPMLHFTDPSGNENCFYKVVIRVNGILPESNDYVLVTTEFMDGMPVHQVLPVSTTDEDQDPFVQGDEINIELQCLDEPAFRFWETLRRINSSLVNPTSNIEGGALGYFSAYSYDNMSIEARW